MTDQSAYLDNEEQTVVIIMTSGPSTPHRCATPFYLASVMSSMDIEVHIFFTMEGVKLMQKGVPENLSALEGGKKIVEFIKDAKKAGTTLHVCQPALPGYNMEDSRDLIPEVDNVARASDLADLVMRADKVITF